MGGVKKAFLVVDGEPLLLRSLRPFLEVPEVEAIVVALPPEDAESPPPFLKSLDPRVRWVSGGATRLQSVHHALAALPAGLRIAVVHDAARPLVSRRIIEECLTQVRAGVGAVAGWPVVDTVQRVDREGFVVETPDRARLWQAHTPQVFPFDELRRAYAHALALDLAATDEASVFRHFGGRVLMVSGAPWNMKVTHPGDAEVATRLLQSSIQP
jgi:2-C-methyl-D-erythritol 4-phosphate cytidylyltransferase